MPLLDKTPFVRQSLPQDIHDDDEVFYCKTTNEAFVTFDEFFERAILCSSMVWTCSVTGRSGLTFEEAIESERTANELLHSFPLGLQLPVLYLMNYIDESKFGAIINMINAFIGNRYFVGEEIFANINGKKISGRINRVTASKDASKSDRTVSFGLDPNLYKYEIQDINDDTVFVVGSERITRTKGCLTKEKIRLFLKQHITSVKRFQPMIVKSSSLEKYGIEQISWNDIFDGPEPNFKGDTIIVKTLNKDKKKAVKESDKNTKESGKSVSKSSKSKKSMGDSNKELSKKSVTNKSKDKQLSPEEKQRIREEMRQQKNEQKRIEKEKMKELKKQQEEQMRVWNAKRDDLACDDLRPLPKPTPVECDIPVELFSDALSVLEFFHNFNELFELKETFPYGITFDLLEKMLIDTDISGPFGDCVRILLSTIFMFQAEEERTTVNNEKEKDESDDDAVENVETSTVEDDKNDDDIKLAIKNANGVVNWIQQHLGVELSDITIDEFNISEILRLHLLCSGAGPKARSKYRGWFASREDPGLWFVMENGDMMKKLDSDGLFGLSPHQRLKLLHVLMDQMLTFVTFREHIDDAFVQISLTKRQLRDLQAGLGKWIREHSIKRQYNANKKDPMNEENGEMSQSQEQIEEFKREKLKKEEEIHKKSMELRTQIRKYQSFYGLKPIGYDRAFRKYWIFESLPGLFVEHSDWCFGTCLNEPTPLKSNRPRTIDAGQSNSTANRCESLKSKFGDDSSTTSDKENEISIPSTDNRASGDCRRTNDTYFVTFDRCTGNVETCSVHGNVNSNLRVLWSFYHKPEQLNDLLLSLNCRGHRESELHVVLSQDKSVILELLNKCQSHVLHKDITIPEVRKSQRLHDQVYHKRGDSTYSQMEPIVAHESALRIFLLEMEEKIFAGGLGHVKDFTRESWRSLIEKEDNVKNVIANLATAILKLASGVRSQFLTLPFSAENGAFERWSESLQKCSNFPQLFVHLNTLDHSISWSKSALKAYCRICRRKSDSENMLLCDECNRGHHTYCLKPPLDSIPHGEWYCSNCKPKFKPLLPKKSRRNLEKIDSDEYENDSDDSGDNSAGDDNSTDVTSLSSKDPNSAAISRASTPEDDICFNCHEKGNDINCISCHRSYHLNCVNLTRRISNWLCNNCTSRNLRLKKKLNYDDDDTTVESKRPKRNGRYPNGDAHYANAQSTYSDNEQNKESDSKFVKRRGDSAKKLPLDFAMCEEMLKRMQKHDDSWLFHKVPKKDVAPNYSKIIKRHIDFGSLVSRLNMGRYRTNIEFFNDILLMFENCRLYWPLYSIEYKSGKIMAHYFEKLLKEYDVNLSRTR